MATVEIEQAELDSLTKATKLFNSLLDSPQHGLSLKKTIKELHPTAQIRDLDLIQQVTAPYDAKLAEQQAKMEALEKQIAEDKQTRENSAAETALRASLDKIRKENGFTDEGMSKVLETMRDRNLAHDPEAAAALVRQAMPKGEPTSTRSSMVAPRLDIYGLQGDKSSEEKFKQLHTQPWAFLEDEVVAFFNEQDALESAA